MKGTEYSLNLFYKTLNSEYKILFFEMTTNQLACGFVFVRPERWHVHKVTTLPFARQHSSR